MSGGGEASPRESGLPALAPGALHVWFCDLDALRDPEFLASCRAQLDAEETGRLQRFVFAPDRHRFLVSHALLRSVLSLYGALDAASWRFAKGEHGKPGLIAGQREIAPQFNLSHSGSLALLAVSADAGKLGIDVEFHHLERSFHGLARRNFAPGEAARLRGLADAELASEFYDLWTLKEAFVKACGDGLSRSLADFWFRFDRAGGSLAFDARPALETEPGRWDFWSYRLDGPYSAAVALRADARASRQDPLWFACVPGRSWRSMAADCILRSSRRITGN